MIANDGDAEGLFRAGIMQSGSPLPVGDFEHGQQCAIICYWFPPTRPHLLRQTTTTWSIGQDAEARRILWNACGPSRMIPSRQLLTLLHSSLAIKLVLSLPCLSQDH